MKYRVINTNNPPKKILAQETNYKVPIKVSRSKARNSKTISSFQSTVIGTQIEGGT